MPPPPLFEELLERLASEHKREIGELRAEIARLSQIHNGKEHQSRHSAGKDDVVKISYEVEVPCRWDDEEVFQPEIDEAYPFETVKTPRGEEESVAEKAPDEEALAAAFAVATDLADDKDVMTSVGAWPGEEILKSADTASRGTNRKKSAAMSDKELQGLSLWRELTQVARHEIYVAELPSVHPKWNLQESPGFNLKNLIDGAQTKPENQASADALEHHGTNPVVRHSLVRERCVEGLTRLLIMIRTFSPEIPLGPSSVPRVSWDTFGFTLLFHDLIMAPMAAFESHSDETKFTMPLSYDSFTAKLDYVSAIFWTCDMMLAFITAYVTNAGIMERRMRSIAVHYLKTWFPVDLCIVAIDLGLLILMGRSQGYIRLTKTISRVMRITRLLRFVKMSKHISELMARINSEYILQIIGLLRLLVVIVILNHYIACLWFLISSLSSQGGPSWVQYNLVDMGYHDLGYAYFSSLHWSLTQFTPASMEIFPENVYERMFNVCIIMCAFVFFSSFVSSITNAMTHIRNINAKAVARDTMIRRFFSDNNISHGLAARVWHFVRQKRVAASKKLRTEEVPILQQLPVNIRNELGCEVYGPILRVHPMINIYLSQTPAALRKICKKAISEVSLASGKELKLDDVRKMLFITGGTLEFHMLDSHEDDESGFLVETGEWCCEAALWAEKVPLDGHFIAAPGGSEIVLLDGEAFRAVAVESYETFDVLKRYSWRFVECFRAAMQDPRAIKDDLLFNSTDTIKNLVVEVTDTCNSRRTLLRRISSASQQRKSADK